MASTQAAQLTGFLGFLGVDTDAFDPLFEGVHLEQGDWEELVHAYGWGREGEALDCALLVRFGMWVEQHRAAARAAVRGGTEQAFVAQFVEALS